LFFCFYQQTKAQSFSTDSLVELEYRYFKSSNEFEKQQLLIRKINHYLLQNYTGAELLKEIKRVQPGFILDSVQRRNFYWNASILAYLNGAYDMAEFEINQYRGNRNDFSFDERLLNLVVILFRDTLTARQEMYSMASIDSAVLELESCIAKETYTRKHKNFYLLSSALLPGSGTAMNGAVLKGMTSLLLLSTTAYGVAALIYHQLYFNAIMWGTGLGLKFYVGNLQLTEKQFQIRQESTRNQLSGVCNDCLLRLFKKHTLSLRIL